ncbi:hypothetical protein J6590_022514 [Homalodisca vitripennis]|nr:hypothetical protein J6590_022514 [Homalodisca vitripennis]
MFMSRLPSDISPAQPVVFVVVLCVRQTATPTCQCETAVCLCPGTPTCQVTVTCLIPCSLSRLPSDISPAQPVVFVLCPVSVKPLCAWTKSTTNMSSDMSGDMFNDIDDVSA